MESAEVFFGQSTHVYKPKRKVAVRGARSWMRRSCVEVDDHRRVCRMRCVVTRLLATLQSPVRWIDGRSRSVAAEMRRSTSTAAQGCGRHRARGPVHRRLLATRGPLVSLASGRRRAAVAAGRGGRRTAAATGARDVARRAGKVFDNMYYVGHDGVLVVGDHHVAGHHPARRDLRLLGRGRSRRAA